MAEYSITQDQRTFNEQLEVREDIGNYYVSLLGLRMYATHELLQLVQKGMPYATFENFAQNSSIPREQLHLLLQLPLRTLQRRKREGALHSDESDRLLRAARVFAKAVALFEGNYEAAQTWFTSSQPALGGSSPLEFASSELGAHEVEAIIARLEHGIAI